MSQPEAYLHPGRVESATGAAMLISRQCLAAVGPWDESWFLYSEEVDYALRARDAGFSVQYEPLASAVHLGGASAIDPALWSLVVRDEARLHRRRHGRIHSSAYAAAVLTGEALRGYRRPFDQPRCTSFSHPVGRRPVLAPWSHLPVRTGE